jgi:hypothetical protein
MGLYSKKPHEALKLGLQIGMQYSIAGEDEIVFREFSYPLIISPNQTNRCKLSYNLPPSTWLYVASTAIPNISSLPSVVFRINFGKVA